MKNQILRSQSFLLLFNLAFIYSCQQQPAQVQESAAAPPAADTQQAVPSAPDEPVLQIKDFIPPQWKTIRKVTGDLNKDGLADVALVIQGTDRRKIHFDADLQENIDENTRALLLLFAKPDPGGYELALQADEFIPMLQPGLMDDPLGDMTISKGVLKVKTGAMSSMGSWTSYFTDYVFRYQDGFFALIGVEQSEFDRNSGDYTKTSVNLLTRNYFIEVSNEFEENVNPKIVRGKLPDRGLMDLSVFKPGDEYEIMKLIPR